LKKKGFKRGADKILGIGGSERLQQPLLRTRLSKQLSLVERLVWVRGSSDSLIVADFGFREIRGLV